MAKIFIGAPPKSLNWLQPAKPKNNGQTLIFAPDRGSNEDEG
jgi:hypothetical protein